MCIMEILKGYQNTTPETFGKGVNTWFDGKTYNILNFDEKDIDLEYIAISLSRIYRYAGHTKMSVAQHSCMMANCFLLLGNINKAKQAWGHDQSEAYLGDIVKPLKTIVKPIFSKIEIAIEKKLAFYFSYKYPFDSDVIDIVDKNSSQLEMVLMTHPEIFSGDYYWSSEISAKRYIEMFKLILKLEEYDKKDLIISSNNNHKP